MYYRTEAAAVNSALQKYNSEYMVATIFKPAMIGVFTLLSVFVSGNKIERELLKKDFFKDTIN